VHSNQSPFESSLEDADAASFFARGVLAVAWSGHTRSIAVLAPSAVLPGALLRASVTASVCLRRHRRDHPERCARAFAGMACLRNCYAGA
jgi:hypothetical protein